MQVYTKKLRYFSQFKMSASTETVHVEPRKAQKRTPDDIAHAKEEYDAQRAELDELTDNIAVTQFEHAFNLEVMHNKHAAVLATMVSLDDYKKLSDSYNELANKHNALNFKYDALLVAFNDKPP